MTKKYDGGFVGIEDISFQVSEGEVVGIIGPNGAGKTTTLKTVAGLIEPTSGYAKVKDEKSNISSTRKNIGFLPEESPVYDNMTAKSYLRFFGDLYGVDRSLTNERIESILSDLDLDYDDKKIGDLSKGMTRKILIARSLINDPDVLIYDEPASGLDPYTTNYIVDYVEELAGNDKGIIFSAHNLYHVESLCDRVIIVDKSKVVASGTVSGIMREFGTNRYDVILDSHMDGCEKEGDEYKLQVNSREEVDEIKSKANQRDIDIVDVYSVKPSLEDIFLDIVEIGEDKE